MKNLGSLLFLFFLLGTIKGQVCPPDIKWQKALGGSGSDYAISIQQTSDGAFTSAGYSNSNDEDVMGSHGNNDVWITRLSSSGTLDWQKSLGGSEDDRAFALLQTPDDGYIIAGSSKSEDGDVNENNGGSDYWIIKLDVSGDILWEKSFGGSGEEKATAVALTSDGGFIAAGFSNSSDSDVTVNYGGYDYWIIKMDSSGNLLWQKSLGGSLDDQAYSVQQTADGKYIIAGYAESYDQDVSGNHGQADVWVAMLDTAGSLEWAKCFGGSHNDEAFSIQQTLDNGYIVAGGSYSNDGDVSGHHGNAGQFEDYWIFRLDASANLMWQQSFGGLNHEAAHSVEETFDGGFIVGGNTFSSDGDVLSNHGNSDYWIIKLTSAGSISWQLCMGGYFGDFANAVQQTNDGGYITAGRAASTEGDISGNHGGDDYWIVKLDTVEVEWITLYADLDGDFFGDPDNSVTFPTCLPIPANYISDNLDCDDNDANVHPGVCDETNGIDDDCDGYIDSLEIEILYYPDNDSDGFGDGDNPYTGCTIPANYVTNNFDCDDNSAAIFPGAPEILNSTDDNCNGYADEGLIEDQQCFGGDKDDQAFSITQTSNEGFLVAGASYSHNGNASSNNGKSDYWIVRLKPSGNLEWEKSLGGTSYEEAHAALQTSDSGFVVCGWSSSDNGDVIGNHGRHDYWVLKFNAAGIIDWQKSLGGSGIVTGADQAFSASQTFDGGYVVAGFSNSYDGDVSGNHGGYDYWIVKLNASGDIQWQRSFGGDQDETAQCIRHTTDGGFIIAGYSLSDNGDVSGNHEDFDYWIVKLDETGNIEWQKCYGGTRKDYAQSVWETNDGGYIVAGYSNSNNGDVAGNHYNNGIVGYDYWIIKLTGDGDLEWQKCLGGENYDYAHAIQQTPNGGYIVAGYSNSHGGDISENKGGYDYWIVKLDIFGNIDWQKSFGGSYDDFAQDITKTKDGGYVIAGFSYSIDGDVTGNHGASDFWIVKIIDDTLSTFLDDPLNSQSSFSLFPNPSDGKITITASLLQPSSLTLQVFDLTGRLLYSEDAGLVINFSKQFEFTTLSSGVYLIKFLYSGKQEVKKLLIER